MEGLINIPTDNFLDKVKNIHFIGIGGSGMCPMAEILCQKGYSISGSDNYESDTLVRIKKSGISVNMGHDKKNVNGAELVVYSAAIKEDNPERIAAKDLGIVSIERSVMLGMIANKFKRSFAIAGTHGKTTATAMLTQILVEGEKDPTAIIGGKFPFLNGNSRVGSSEIIVCEACEYVNSFLELTPDISIILNIDADHLDYFKSLENIKRSFGRFINQTKSLVIINGDDSNTREVIEKSGKPFITYGLNKENDYYAENISKGDDLYTNFSLMKQGKKLIDMKIKIPGKHNIYNALAAVSAAYYQGVDLESIQRAIKNFSGVHRRFELLGNPKGITVIDDFAHHPTEIRSTLTTAMDMGFKKVYAIFQPHTYSRTYMLLNDFAETLSIADNVVLSEILAVREENIYNIYAKDLAEKIDGCVWFKTSEEIADYVVSVAKPGDLLITLGGGNVYKCANMIMAKLGAQ